MRRAFVHSLGCRASQADGAAIEESLRKAGFETLRDPAAADLVVLNTCTVTHSADVDARRMIRSFHRDHPSAQILVTGCYAQRAPEELAQLEGVRWVVGNSHKTSIAGLVSAEHEEFHGQILRSDFDRHAPFLASPVRDVREDRTRPNLKIQDGCGNRCSFCIIPSVRGPSRSAVAKSIVEQVRDLSTRYCEIVLTGINLGRWGRDLPGQPTFEGLIRKLLTDTNVRRVRISSVEPMDWSDQLLSLMADNPRIAQHVHMPLQSGSDRILKRMFRRYRTRHYENRLAAAYRLLPDAAFGADVMTGFPGETNDEFAETVRFIDALPFTYLHVFTYSERPGTMAANMSELVPVELRRERTEVLRRLSAKKNLAFRRRMVGRTLSAVTLEEPGIALTSNYLRVRMATVRTPNQMVNLAVGGVTDQGLTEQNILPVLS